MYIQGVETHIPTCAWIHTCMREREPDRELEQVQKRLPRRIYLEDVNKVNETINSGRSHIYKQKCVQGDSQPVHLPVTFRCLFVAQTRRTVCYPSTGWARSDTDWGALWYCTLWLDNILCHRVGYCQTLIGIPEYWQLLWDILEGSVTPYIKKWHSYSVLGVQRWRRICPCLLETHKITGVEVGR